MPTDGAESAGAAWLTDAFARRVTGLHRTRLRDLYPSEAWSLYRVIPQCHNVLDMGCGSGAMFEIVRTLSDSAQYTGVDMNPALVASAKNRYSSSHAEFIHADALRFLETCEARFDCVMSWALLYAVPDFDALIERMIACTSRFVLFDMRVANVAATIADTGLAYTVYDDVKAPVVIGSFPALLQTLRQHDELKAVEISGYDMPLGSTSWISSSLPPISIVSVVLERTPADEAGPGRGLADWYVKVPSRLLTERI